MMHKNIITIQDLTNIPYKLNEHDFEKTDCLGLVYLYYKHIKDITINYTDGQRIKNEKGTKENIKRIIDGCNNLGFHKIEGKKCIEGDVVFILARNFICMGVAIDKFNILMTTIEGGSHIRKINQIRLLIHSIYRMNNEKISN